MSEEDTPSSPIFKTRPEPPPGREVYHFGAGMEAPADAPAPRPMSSEYRATSRLPLLIVLVALLAAAIVIYAFLG